MQPHPLASFFRQIWAKFGKNWVKFGQTRVKFDWAWTKIKILHPQKHSISYDYDSGYF